MHVHTFNYSLHCTLCTPLLMFVYIPNTPTVVNTVTSVQKKKSFHLTSSCASAMQLDFLLNSLATFEQCDTILPPRCGHRKMNLQ